MCPKCKSKAKVCWRWKFCALWIFTEFSKCICCNFRMYGGIVQLFGCYVFDRRSGYRGVRRYRRLWCGVPGCSESMEFRLENHRAGPGNNLVKFWVNPTVHGLAMSARRSLAMAASRNQGLFGSFLLSLYWFSWAESWSVLSLGSCASSETFLVKFDGGLSEYWGPISISVTIMVEFQRGHRVLLLLVCCFVDAETLCRRSQVVGESFVSDLESFDGVWRKLCPPEGDRAMVEGLKVIWWVRFRACAVMKVVKSDASSWHFVFGNFFFFFCGSHHELWHYTLVMNASAQVMDRKEGKSGNIRVRFLWKKLGYETLSLSSVVTVLCGNCPRACW